MPAALTGPHAGGLGIKFYTGNMFPKTYQNVAFIARRGSWNREKKFGYDVALAQDQPDGTAKIEPFMTGLLDEAKNEFYGRPIYVLQMPDGALLVSDEQNGATYRISYAQRSRSAGNGVMRAIAAMVAAAGPRAGGRRALRRRRIGAEHAARRADHALRHLPWRGRQFAHARTFPRSPASRNSSCSTSCS